MAPSISCRIRRQYAVHWQTHKNTHSPSVRRRDVPEWWSVTWVVGEAALSFREGSRQRRQFPEVPTSILPPSWLLTNSNPPNNNNADAKRRRRSSHQPSAAELLPSPAALFVCLLLFGFYKKYSAADGWGWEGGGMRMEGRHQLQHIEQRHYSQRLNEAATATNRIN